MGFQNGTKGYAIIHLDNKEIFISGHSFSLNAFPFHLKVFST